jgi:hypothetical protein
VCRSAGLRIPDLPWIYLASHFTPLTSVRRYTSRDTLTLARYVDPIIAPLFDNPRDSLLIVHLRYFVYMTFSIPGIAGALIQTVYFNEDKYKKKQELCDVIRIFEKIQRKRNQLLMYSAGVSAGLALSVTTLCPSNLLFTFFSARQMGVLYRQLDLLHEKVHATLKASLRTLPGPSLSPKSPDAVPIYKTVVSDMEKNPNCTATSPGKPMLVFFGPSPPPSSTSLCVYFQLEMPH